MLGRLFRVKTKTPTKFSPRLPEGTRVYAIGDIHGRSDLLDLMHHMIGEDISANRPSECHIIYLGDYIDRGHDSCGVLKRLSGPPPFAMKRTLLMGNHEQMLLRFLDDGSNTALWRQFGGMETLLSYRIDVNTSLATPGFPGLGAELANRMPPQHLQFLQSLVPSVSVGDYFFCHAGVRPGVPLDAQRERDLLWIRDEFLESGTFFGKMVVHGHSPVEKPDFRGNRINIDTAAYLTGRLTCLVLEGEEQRTLST
jgi:diadenosine tetraphosphatase ApaH/serine/threonine PP2A family protein phosphatase